MPEIGENADFYKYAWLLVMRSLTVLLVWCLSEFSDFFKRIPCLWERQTFKPSSCHWGLNVVLSTSVLNNLKVGGLRENFGLVCYKETSLNAVRICSHN